MSPRRLPRITTPLPTTALHAYRSCFRSAFGCSHIRNDSSQQYAAQESKSQVATVGDIPLLLNATTHGRRKMINWSKLWNIRHEPVVVLVSIAVLLLAATIIYLTVNQVIFRGAPIVCGSQYFPEEKEDCEGVQGGRAQRSDNLPIGTIVAFFGLDADIPKGWIVCDGQTIPENSHLSIDANAEEGGKQVPDLRGKFVRGTETPLDGIQLLTGGEDNITINHSHVWGEFHAKKWYSYDTAGNRFSGR